MNTKLDNERFLPPLWISMLMGACLILWLAAELREIVVLLVVGYSVAFIIDPVLDYLQKKKISREIGVLAIFGVALIVILSLTLTAIPTIVREWGELQARLPTIFEKLRSEWLPSLLKYKELLPDAIQQKIKPDDLFAYLPNIGSKAFAGVTTGISNTLLSGYSLTLTIANLALLPFIVFYLALDIDKLHTTILHLLPRSRRLSVRKICLEMSGYVSAFIRGQIAVGFILFLLYAIGLGIVGIELWFLVALIAGLGNIIPYFGFFIGIVLATLMSLLTFGDFTHVIYVWGVFAIVQALEGTLITPKIMGDQVGLSPLAVILFIFAGGKLFGLLGIFLAIPCAAVLRVLGREMHTWLIKRIEEEQLAKAKT